MRHVLPPPDPIVPLNAMRNGRLSVLSAAARDGYRHGADDAYALIQIAVEALREKNAKNITLGKES